MRGRLRRRDALDRGCESILYRSGDLPVHGFVVRPWPSEPGRRYPAIVYNRGGNGDFGKIGAADLRFFRRLAREGFVVLASQYRGTDGAPGRDEFGGADRPVPPQQSEALAAALRRAGRPVELDVFPGEDHSLSGHIAARDERILAWFRAHRAG